MPGYMTLLFLIFANLLTSHEACNLFTNSDSAAAKSALPIDYPRYSCTPCGVSSDQEVHIINMYKPVGFVRKENGIPVGVKTVPIHLANNRTDITQPVKIKLLLLGYEAVHWEIHNPNNVIISQVILMNNYSAYSSVKLNGGGPLQVTAHQGSFLLRDSDKAIRYADYVLGSVTSYTAVYETSKWSLTVGDCLAKLLFTTTTIHPDSTGVCRFRINDKQRSADISSTTRGDYPIYSCTPCVRADFEVHVLNMYKPTKSSRARGVLEVPVTIRANNFTDIKLILISYEAANWVITKPAMVTIIEIALMSQKINRTTVKVKDSDPPIVTSYEGYISGWESEWSLKNLVWKIFGFLSSYTGVRDTYSWILKVGKCISEPVNLTALLQTTTTTTWRPVDIATFEPPSEPGSVNVAASVSGVLAIVVVFIIAVICIYKCRKKSTADLPSRSYHSSTGELIPSATPMAPSAPSHAGTPAPTSSAPPELQPPALGLPSEEGAPPAYDEAMTYPLAAGAGGEHPPPTYNEAV